MLTALAQEGELAKQLARTAAANRGSRVVSASPESQPRGLKRAAAAAGVGGDGSNAEGLARSSGKIRVSGGGGGGAASDGGGREVSSSSAMDVVDCERRGSGGAGKVSGPGLPGFVSGGVLEGGVDDMEMDEEDGGGGGSGARVVETSALKVREVSHSNRGVRPPRLAIPALGATARCHT